jgi:hypothetical protein
MEALLPIAIVLVICLVIAGIVYASQQAKKRREDLARIATTLELSFDTGDPFNIPSRYSAFGLLSAGHNCQAYNVVHGRRGRYAVKAFDYIYYTTETSTETSTDAQGQTTTRQVTREVSHVMSAVVFDVGAGFPPLFIRPENFLDKIAAAIGFGDINFESAEFSRKFYVKSSDKKFAYDVIHPRMMEFLLANPRWTLELKGQGVLASQGTLRPEQFREGIEFVEAFLGNIPDYLWQELKHRA